jgi:hypothetical protein
MRQQFALALFCGLVAGLSTIAHAEESPWEVIGRKESWRPYCEKTKALMAANLVRAYDLHDEAFSDIPVPREEPVPVWSVKIAGISFPIPRYSQPIDYFQ